MRLAVIGCATYYGKGQSYERGQVAASLTALGHDVLFVPITIFQAFTDAVYMGIAQYQPDLILFIPHTHEVNPANLRQCNCPIVLLLADDDWRRDYGLMMAQQCDYVLGNAPDSVAAYGIKGVPFEWAVYPGLFAGDDCQRVYSVTFIGQNYGNRNDYFNALKAVGIEPVLRGMGIGGSTAIPPETMAELLRQSKIGLNLSRTSQDWNRTQIKIRPFEIGAAGALILTEYSPGIEKSFIDGKEAIFFETIGEMTEAALYYLAHDTERERIAAAGYARVMRDHTLECRWHVLFEAVGL